MKKYLFSLFVFGYLILFPSISFAYLDPGTTSLVLQILGAVFISSMFFIKSIFRKVTGFCKKFTGKLKKEDSI